MKVLAIDHVTINCKDPERTFRFYEEVLGLPKNGTPIDMGDHELFYYSLPHSRLEIIRYKTDQPVLDTVKTSLGIWRHLALEVDDIDAVYKAGQQFGAKITVLPSYVEKLGKKTMLIIDPNGVEIEITQSR
ncbi:VOC family protein [Treponema primitia]|uniref:VOC family protein n=1 Tax=Treponema primitia TaxID=88058 RepID=UPI00397F58AD